MEIEHYHWERIICHLEQKDGLYTFLATTVTSWMKPLTLYNNGGNHSKNWTATRELIQGERHETK